MQTELQSNLMELKQEKNNICKLLSGKRNLLNSQYKEIIECKNNNRKLEIQNCIPNIRVEIEKLEEELDNTEQKILMMEMTNWNLISFNENIDLYKLDNELDGTYFIYIHSKPVEAGVICYNPKYSNSIFGDISYSVYDEYQGHNYAFQALCMLSNHLEQNGVSSIRISARKDNIPSVKTIQKYEKVNPCKKIMNLEDTSIVCDFTFKKFSKKLIYRCSH